MDTHLHNLNSLGILSTQPPGKVLAIHPRAVIIQPALSAPADQKVKVTRAKIEKIRRHYPKTKVVLLWPPANTSELTAPADFAGQPPDCVCKSFEEMFMAVLPSCSMLDLVKRLDDSRTRLQSLVEAQKKEEAKITGFTKLLQHTLQAPAPTPTLPEFWTEYKDMNVLLDNNSPEARMVVSTFAQGGHGVALKPDSLRIFRIQAVSQWERYVTARNGIGRKHNCKPHEVTEKWLFHGTTRASAEMIAKPYQGFDARLCGTNGVTYGKGVYFAYHPQYSLSFRGTPKDEEGFQYVFLVRALTGRAHETKHGMTRPPPIDASKPDLLYDSGVDCFPNPNIAIIFDNAQAYPAYLVRLKM